MGDNREAAVQNSDDYSMSHNSAKSVYAESQRPRPGFGEFKHFAVLYGTLSPQKIGRNDLDFYPYHDQLAESLHLADCYGYRVYFGGGRFGVPNLAAKNYYSGYLMVYDPSDQKGRIAISHEYALSYSILHELGHALTLENLNTIYGDGHRLGSLGKHRTLREAVRALHWEILAVEKQRQLTEEMGVFIDDRTYEMERNTVLSEATMRAVTGRFTEPNNEGFYPHDRHVNDNDVLAPVFSAANEMGITGWNELLSSRKPKGISEYYSRRGELTQNSNAAEESTLPKPTRYLGKYGCRINAVPEISDLVESK